MQIRTATVVLQAARGRVFRYLANPKNHAEWATEFIRETEETDGQLYAKTEMGRVRYDVDADDRTGVIDVLVTPTDGPVARFPARVVALGPEFSAFIFSMAQPPGMPDEEFDRGYASLERELENLRRCF